MLQEEITALGLAMCVQSNAKAMEISDGTVENEDTLPQEIRGAFSEELYTIRNLEATTTRLVISYCESCHENCHSLCLRGQGKVHHSKLQPRKAPMEMLNNSTAVAKTITPKFEGWHRGIYSNSSPK